MKKYSSKILSSFNAVLFDNADGAAGSRRRSIGATYLTAIFTNLITGSYFVGLMLAMGADSAYISYVTMATTLCSFMQFFSPLILERMQRRKAFLIFLRAVYHFLNIVIVGVIPLLPLSKTAMLITFFTAVVALNLINSLSTSGISVWYIQNVPSQKHSDYFALSNVGSTLISTVTVFLGGCIVDKINADGLSLLTVSPSFTAFLVLRVIALIAALLELFCMLRINESPYPTVSKTDASSGLRMLFLPLRDRKFMKTISVYIIWYFLTGIVGSYFQVYLLDMVHMSYTYISLSGIIGLPFMLLFTPLWSSLIDRFSWKKILPFAMIGTAFAYFFNTWITANTQFFHIIVMIFYQTFASCITLIFAFLPYVSMPKSYQTAYLNLFTICGTLASFGGILFGDVFMKATEGLTLNIFGITLVNYQYLNLVQAIPMLLIGVSFWRQRYETALQYH